MSKRRRHIPTAAVRFTEVKDFVVRADVKAAVAELRAMNNRNLAAAIAGDELPHDEDAIQRQKNLIISRLTNFMELIA